MRTDNFEKIVADKLQNHEVEPSAKVMENIFSRRTKGYILLNHLRLNKLAYSAAAVIIAGILVMVFSNGHTNADNRANALTANEATTQTGTSAAVSADGTSETPKDLTLNNNIAEGASDQITSFSEKSHHTTVGVTHNRKQDISNTEAHNTTGATATSQHHHAVTGTAMVPSALTTIMPGNSKKLSLSEEDRLYMQNAIDIDDIIFGQVFNYLKYKTFKPVANRVSPFEMDVKQVDLLVQDKDKLPTQRHKPLYVDVLYAPYWGQKQYSGSAMNPDVSLSYRYSQATTLRLSYPLYKGLMIQAGISRMNIAENYNYQPANPDKYRIDVVKQYIIDPAGPVVVKTTYDTVRYKMYGTYGKNVQNQYSIPVGFSQVFNISSKFNVSVNAGTILNMISGGKGLRYQYTNREEVVSYTQKSKTDFSMGYYIGGTLSYEVAPRWSLLAEPNFRFTKLAGANNGIACNQHYYLYGSAFGLRYTW